jgi:putative membrane protein
MIPRRTVLAALATAAAAPACAQSLSGEMAASSSALTLPDGIARSSPAQSLPENMATGEFSSDHEYIRQSLVSSSLSLAVSRIAAERLQVDDLKEFAQLEVAEQETLADVLKSLMVQNAGLTERTIRRPGDAEVEQNLDLRGREVLEKMRTESAGADFDRAYLGVLANGHLELLRIQETYLDSGRTNRSDIINVAKLARGMIKEHLQLLADIESGMEAAGATAGATTRRNR